jgi:hypothetical protein
MESEWYYVRNGTQTGPVSFDELKAAAASGLLTPDDLVWQQGTADWVPARTVTGLFATPPPPPARSSPPPLSPPAKSEPDELPLDDSPPPTASAGEVFALAKVFLSRVTATSPAAIVPTPHEEDCLTRAGILEPLARRYALWRRAVLWVSVLPTTFAALFWLISLLAISSAEYEAWRGFGLFVMYLGAFSLFALPVCAILAANVYDNLRTSARLVLLGAVISLGVPLLIAFVPGHLLLDFEEVGREGRIRLIMGLGFYLTLLPAVVSLLPAVTRACVRMKTFMPQSLAPGWGLVASVPLFVLLTLATFIVLYQFIGNGVLMLALFLWIGAPLFYLTKFGLLTRPITEKRDMLSLANTQLAVFGMIAGGVFLLIIFLFTAKVGNTPLVGTDSHESMLRPWSLEIHRKWIEYLGRSLFMTILFADVLVRMVLSMRREERALANTPAGATFDKSLDALGDAISPKRES